jgi:L-fuculose-phosphate aldolase
VSSKLRKEVALGAWVIDDCGLSELGWGEVSARDPQGRGVWMTPPGIGLHEVVPADVVLVSWEGEVLEGEAQRPDEYPIHTEAMLASPAIKGVVHAHPPHAIALAASGRLPQPFSHVGGVFARPVPLYDRAPGRVLTSEQGRALADARGEHAAILLRGHGIVTVGASVALAATLAVMLEHACELQLLAGAIKPPYTQAQALEAYSHAQDQSFILETWQPLARRAQRTHGTKK